MTALVINCVIGSGIFGIPSELTRLVGWMSPLAMIAGAVAQFPLIAATAEVASQFCEPGGAYLYARTLFGRFAGIQVGWFSLLAPIAGVAANAGLFVTYLGGLVPGARSGLGRAVALALLIALPAIANYVGVRRGGRFSSVLVVAKLLPMVILIALGLMRPVPAETPAQYGQWDAPGWSEWIGALLLLAFAYGGYEDALVPAGEVKDPRRTMGFALGIGLLACTVLYTLLQMVTVATIGLSNSGSPLTEVASVLIGSKGAMFVSVAAMLSTYGNVSAGILTTPRLAYSLAAHGEFPALLGKVHPRYNTPAIAIVCFSALVWLLAETGTFLWALALSAGSMMVMYAGTCAALIRLRMLRPGADALRIPFGSVTAVIGILIACALLTQLAPGQWLLMLVMFAVGVVHWYWVKVTDTRRAATAVAAAE
jgi:amino acid transporter